MVAENELLEQLITNLNHVLGVSLPCTNSNNDYFVVSASMDLKKIFKESNFDAEHLNSVLIVYENNEYSFEGREEDFREYCNLLAERIIETFYNTKDNTYELEHAKGIIYYIKDNTYELEHAKEIYSLLGTPEMYNSVLEELTENERIVDELLKQGELEEAGKIYYFKCKRIIGSKFEGMKECSEAALAKKDYETAIMAAHYSEAAIMREWKKKRMFKCFNAALKDGDVKSASLVIHMFRDEKIIKNIEKKIKKAEK